MSSVPLAVRSVRHNQPRWLFAAGLAVVLAALTKVTALAYIAPIAWWLLTSGRARAAMWFVLGTIALFTATGHR
jgi:4-amino-4-deoxy-L-arabinose transferase-like glycosyltransferase